MSIICCGCGKRRHNYEFSSKEIAKGLGAARCDKCRGRHPARKPEHRQKTTSGRYNGSGNAEFEEHDLKHPFGEGSFRYVSKGRYTSGPRKGEACVAKFFKNKGELADEFFADDKKVVTRTLEIVRKFNDKNIISQKIKVNVPEMAQFGQGSGRPGTKFQVEPYIDKYQKWNSNSGWNDSKTRTARKMQALSHFSYHDSGGRYLLCDVQGGDHGDRIVLTDPVIISKSHGYGVTDLGPEGMRTFFHKHKCNEYCDKNWSTPSKPAARYPIVPGTTMLPRRERFREPAGNDNDNGGYGGGGGSGYGSGSGGSGVGGGSGYGGGSGSGYGGNLRGNPGNTGPYAGGGGSNSGYGGNGGIRQGYQYPLGVNGARRNPFENPGQNPARGWRPPNYGLPHFLRPGGQFR
ncbi:kinase-like domain-containing protein [Lasiosphaeria ovina]|uniref:Kinase-like domain-containing protein n=1 Tax=Lasiosphaeria ovina TaxID=92902 RepID=A0AAE0KAF9_9PEZI|nr:kinase-like domain-containing protein [Lasiosphaeria ovina]